MMQFGDVIFYNAAGIVFITDLYSDRKYPSANLTRKSLQQNANRVCIACACRPLNLKKNCKSRI